MVQADNICPEGAVGQQREGLTPVTLDGLSDGHTPSPASHDYRNCWVTRVFLWLYSSNRANADLKVCVEFPISLAGFHPYLFTFLCCNSVLFIPFDPVQSRCILKSDIKNFSCCFTIAKKYGGSEGSTAQPGSSLNPGSLPFLLS